MLRKIRSYIPNNLVNYGKHLPTAVLANLKYGFPSKKLTIVGVTGTDGKTTTVNMIYQILKAAGKKVSMVSTVNAVINNEALDTGFHVTNPSSMALQKYIYLAQESGSEYLVLEVTSHGLEQFRTWGTKFDIGVVTNVTHEHLDYHKTWENYFLAKARLVKAARVVVLNRDETHFNRLAKLAKGRVVSFGLSKEADFSLQKYPIHPAVPGDFNKLNGLAAISVATTLGVNQKVAIKAISEFKGLVGRMEEIKNQLGLRIMVDFAHTPNGLESALKAMRQDKKGRLISVFGAAAERDVAKRPLMGEISASLADITILTDEDPRFDDSLEIIDQIAAGAKRKGALDGTTLFRQPDRQEAIRLAISMAKKGDTIGIFGKGHELSMNYQGIERPWSDQEAVLRALDEK